MSIANRVDPYLENAFPFSDKIRRLCWNLTWFILCKWTPIYFHYWRICVLKFFGAKIGKTNFIYPDCKIWAPWLLETEHVVTIGPGVEVYNPGGVFLSHHSIISQGAFLCGATHDYNSAEFSYIKKNIFIEPYVWICAKAIVLPGVRCKEGSVLGAGSVASESLSAWTVYNGNPMKEIRKRNNFLEKI